MPEEWITTQEAAELSGYNIVYLRQLIRGKQIEGRKWGPVWQVNRQSIVDYLEAAQQSNDKRHGPKD